MMRTLLPFFLITFSYFSFSQNYQLIQKEDEASCMNYEIVDSLGIEVKLPKMVASALLCPSVIDLKGNRVIYRELNEIMMYNMNSHEFTTLFTVYDDIDGISSPVWSENEARMMFVVVNQERNHGYKSFCRIISLEFDSNGDMIGKRKFDRPVHFVCGSICSPEPNVDFMYSDNNTIRYKRNENIEEDPGVFEEIELK